MATHNAKGRSNHPSKAQRQQALAIHNKPLNPELHQDETKKETLPESDHNQGVKEETTTTNVVAISPGRGSVTRARWGKCLKARPGAKLIMSPDIKALPPETTIISMRDDNPKKGQSTYTYALYGFANKRGAETTLGAYIKALEPRHGGARAAYGHVAWDVNHGFIELKVPAVAEAPQEPEAPAETTSIEEAMAEAEAPDKAARSEHNFETSMDEEVHEDEHKDSNAA